MTDLVNMDEKQINVFKRIGPIVDDVNDLLNRVQRLEQQSSDDNSETHRNVSVEKTSKFLF